jgi:hypothetical protein
MNRHRLRTAAIGLLACGALAAPAAADPPSASYAQPSSVRIGDTPADFPGADSAPVALMPKIGDTPADYPGMAGVRAPAELADPASARPHAGEAHGFDWPSAAIGAAGAALLLVVSMGGVSLLSHRRTRLAR